MKNNLKTKVMLAVLAGGMLCANGAWAGWYGTASGFVNSVPNPVVLTGINLTIDTQTMVNGDTVAYAGSVYGGYTGNNENVSNNTITFDIGDVTINAGIYGGHSGSGSATHNSVIVDSGTFNCDCGINGGYSSSGNAASNTITINNGTFNCKIYGGFSGGGVAGGDTPESGNKVIINNGTFSSYVYGGWSEGNNVKNNSVTIKGGTFSSGIYGGYSSSGNATGNSVTIDNGTFNGVEIHGGSSDGGTVGGDTLKEGNKVIVNGGTFNDTVWIIGGYSEDDEVDGDVKNNSVIVNGDITYEDLTIYGGKCDGSAINNSVTINGDLKTNGFGLVGGVTVTGTSSGNILNVKTKITGKAYQVGYFQIMNFTLPANITEDDKPMLSTEVLVVTESGGSATINVKAADGVKLSAGDTITLISADGANGTFISGADILGGAGKLIYTVGEAAPVDELTDALTGDVSLKIILEMLQDFEQKSNDTATTKAIAEGIAASLAFVNQGADMVATSGIDGLYVADSENPTIAAFSGNKTRYNTGSHVDIHGWNALAGVALNNKASFSHGVFVEIGNGDIDTYAALNGSGSSDYKGGGYMLRKDMGKGWTIDGAVRAGRVETSWGNDTKGGYEAKQTYYGAHVTFNKMLKEYGEQKLNGYLRYTFTHLGSDSVNLDGTHYGFDSVNSHRTRLGARMVDEGQNGFELYYGAAWEYGFGGDCDATVNGVTTSGPAVDGSNGVFEVGGTWSDNKWEISAGLEAYAGAKRGVAGGMNFIYKF